MILQQLPYRKSFFSNVYIDHIICGIFGISLLAQLVMNPLAMWETWVRSLGSIPGLARSPGEGKGYAFYYSDLENSMDCIGLGVAECQT